MATTHKSSRATFRVASRGSQLAQIQTNSVVAALQDAFPSHSFGTSFMSTGGDLNKVQALYLLGGKALWTKELEVALQEDAVDMLVHSLKDVPTNLPEGFELGAVLQREQPVDCLVVKNGSSWKTLEELPHGSVVGTGSVRRVAQLRRKFPGLVFLDVRGNIDTRLAKLDDPEGPYAALILAKAGLIRMGKDARVTADVGPPTLYHAVSQGALGLEIRSNDVEARAFCAALTHWQTEWICLAERACLRVLEGGCSVPVGVHSELQVDEGKLSGTLTLVGCVTSIDGQQHVEHTLTERVTSKKEAEAVGVGLAHVLIRTGAKAILDEINIDRERRIGEDKTAAEVEKIEAVMESTA